MLRRTVCGLLAALLWIPAAALGAAPVIRPQGVQNAASFEPASYSQSASPGIYRPAGIAPGSIFLIWGSGLGPEQPASGTMPYGDRLPDVAGGVQVTIRSRGYAEVRAWLLYVSSDQINAILPSTVPVGEAEVIVTYEGEPSQAAAINILASAPGLFSVAQNGRGAGVIQNYEGEGNQPLNQLTRPARPGQYVILWATGLGAISGADNVPPPVGPVNTNLVVQIGGVTLTPDYAGRAPGFPGVDQINVRLPDDGSIPEGCSVPVMLRSGQVSSWTVGLALESDSPACEHPWGLSYEQLARLDAGQPLAIASLSAGSSSDAEPRMYLSARFAHQPPWQIPSQFQWFAVGDFLPAPPETRCFHGSGTFIGAMLERDFSGFVREIWPSIGIDAGDRLFLNGPDGRSVTLVQAESFPITGAYQPETETGRLPDDFMTGGEWALESSGGADVLAFSSSFVLPPPVRAELPESVDRTQDLVVSWDPVSTSESSAMHIQVSVSRPSDEQENAEEIGLVICSTPASAGSITIPSADLAGLSPSAEGTISIRLVGPQSEPVVFAIPGIDRATFSQANSVYRTTEVR